MYVARRRRSDDTLARVIGGEAADLLAEVFGGERFCFPTGAGQSTRRRVASMRKRGFSVARIARELRLSERHVYKVLAALRDA